MNGKVEACKEALMDAIRESEEYLQYEESKAEVADHPELHHLIDDYRRDVYLLQNSSQGNDVSEEMQRMFARRHELCKNEIIHRYITRELSMCRMLQNISMDVMSVTNLELDAFEDVISIDND